MPVQLIIDGNTVTDVLAQVQDLARATGEPVGNVAAGKPQPSGSTNSAPSTTSPSSTKPATEISVAGGKTKSLTREEQDVAVEEMIEAGAKDDRYNLLTKGRQKDVDARLAEKDKPQEAVEDDLGSMFDDEAPVAEISAQDIRDMMAKLGKDDKGQPIQANLLQIRDILTKHIPEGEDVKVGNIPEEKLAVVHAEMKKLEG